MTTKPQSRLLSFADRGPVAKSYKKYFAKASLTFFAAMVLGVFLLPLLYMVDTSLQHPDQRTVAGSPVYPAVAREGTYQGNTYPIYMVPMPDGSTKEMMLVEPGRVQSTFVDPNDASQTPVEWQGSWRTLSQAWSFNIDFDNFTTVWSQLNFPRMLFNTAAIAILSTIAAVTSGCLVAYGFARFRFPGKNMMFVVLLATIILPFQVTLIPTYVIFTRIGWNGTWLPLIIPHLFANAFNVFLLRQYFLSIPRDLDEAAMIDGASPLRILRSVILPMSVPAITAVTLFHFFFSWNDFFLPLLYLQSKPELQTLPVAIQAYNQLYVSEPTLIQAAALMTMAVPVVVFFLAQGAFMRTVVITGVEK